MGEKVRVLVVDDSSFFRNRIRQELEHTGEITIAGEAGNGREAVKLATRLMPDLITMDVAMPEMDGIAAVREIMRAKPTNIIMFSALTRDGARATLNALDAGAVDFLSKQGGLDGAGGPSLSERVLQIARSQGFRHRPQQAAAIKPIAGPVHTPAARPAAVPQVILIGASTGGPVAIQRVLTALPLEYPCPLLVAVHMPAEFTATFAERLDNACALTVRQAADGDLLWPGTALIAPGGCQTSLENRNGRLQVRVAAGGDQIYRPSVDHLFGSAAQAIGGECLAIVLTGMGADGTEGARRLKSRGAAIWSQDQATSVVYGMPQAVVKAGLSDRVMPLDAFGEALHGVV
jgi:two-component system chemotaxis response regulator CheB